MDVCGAQSLNLLVLFLSCRQLHVVRLEIALQRREVCMEVV
jgi:hypothetical protein